MSPFQNCGGLRIKETMRISIKHPLRKLDKFKIGLTLRANSKGKGFCQEVFFHA
jgi:hypothetical protein